MFNVITNVFCRIILFLENEYTLMSHQRTKKAHF